MKAAADESVDRGGGAMGGKLNKNAKEIADEAEEVGNCSLVIGMGCKWLTSEAKWGGQYN